jgi:nucleoid DNA-binding protein
MNMIIQFAQVSSSPDHSALVWLSGSQFFIALIAGITMAFAFQFLLSNLSVAVGISGKINPADTNADGWGKKLRQIEAKVGSATLLIINTALFMACFLAVRLALIHDAGLGATMAVVIWSVYFLLLLWLSSQAIGSLVGTVSNTASSGIQGVTAIIGTALSGRAASSQIANTVETSVDAVSRELQSVLGSDRLRENLENYISQLQLPQASSGSSKNIPNQALDLLSNSNLLPNSSELVNLLKSATSEDLESGRLRERLTQVLGLKQTASGNGHTNGEQTKQSTGLRERTLQTGMDALLATLLKRTNFSGLNLESLNESLGSIGQQLGKQATQVVQQVGQSSPALVIRSDVENYLLHSPSWYLRPESLDSGFREVLFDPNADAGLVRQQLEQLNRASFVEMLNRREGVNPDQINDIADELELIRREVLDTVRQAEEQERSQALRRQVETYLSSVPKEALNSDQLQQDFTALLADPDASYETLGNRLLQFDRNALTQMLLAGRQDLNPEETEQILNNLEGARDRFLNQSQEAWNQFQAQADEFRQRVESYLRETNPAELTADSIQQTLQTLLNTSESGLIAVRIGLGQLDRNALEQILAQRQDINPDQVNQLVNQVETIRDRILHTPQELAGQAKEQVDQITTRIADYLRNTNLEELNPEGIQRDLQQLVNDPQTGISALGNRLSQVDRETLVKLLSQRQDLSQEQVNRAIDQTLDTLRTIARTPRQVADRTRDRLSDGAEQIRDFSSDLADYLRNTNREELNPEGIQRDLQRLLQKPRAGVEQLGERLSQVDRGSLVALLSQRQDISEADANQIVDQVLNQIQSLRERIIQPVQDVAQNVKDQVQATANKASDTTRDYLNSLERPELNYEGIQRDIRKLFDDPEAGVDALRDRLSQFDRDTLVALLSSRPDISEEQANKIIDQVEAARDSVLDRTERLQAKAEARVKALKHQAEEQAEALQKTAASAAWWVFGTAITSVTAAAIAGVLASRGLTPMG